MFSVGPVVDIAVEEPSLYHLMVPSAAICVALSSTPALYTWAVSVVLTPVFLKIVPLEDVMLMVMASAPAGPVPPVAPLIFETYTHFATSAAPATVQR